MLLWDGECGFCRAWAKAAQAKLPPGTVVMPWQSVEDLSAMGLDEDRCRAAVQWHDGTRAYSGARAIARALWAVGGVWAVVGFLLDLPPVRPLARAAYQWVADNRSRLPGPSDWRATRANRAP